jgi:hypothetical protein
MRNISFLALCALAAAVLLPVSGLAAAGGSNLPFKGSGSGTTTLNLLTGQVEVIGTGPISHMGMTSVEQHAQLVPTSPTSYNWVAGTWTATAANGDVLFGTSEGTVTFTDAVHNIAVVNYTSTGGTGRFADAAATFVGTAFGTRGSTVGATTTGTYDATIVGELSY